MLKVGIDVTVYSAHSFKSAASAKTFSKGISIEEIMKTADWSSEHVLLNFINVPRRLIWVFLCYV
jgi:hypothetical protein